VVLGAALALINALGSAAIEAHVRGLCDRLIEGLTRAGAEVVTPPEPAARSGIVTFTLGDGPGRDAAFLGQLRQRRILVSQRYTAGVGGLRVSAHLFNNEDDVGRLVEAVPG